MNPGEGFDYSFHKIVSVNQHLLLHRFRSFHRVFFMETDDSSVALMLFRRVWDTCCLKQPHWRYWRVLQRQQAFYPSPTFRRPVLGLRAASLATCFGLVELSLFSLWPLVKVWRYIEPILKTGIENRNKKRNQKVGLFLWNTQNLKCRADNRLSAHWKREHNVGIESRTGSSE